MKCLRHPVRLAVGRPFMDTTFPSSMASDKNPERMLWLGCLTAKPFLLPSRTPILLILLPQAIWCPQSHLWCVPVLWHWWMVTDVDSQAAPQLLFLPCAVCSGSCCLCFWSLPDVMGLFIYQPLRTVLWNWGSVTKTSPSRNKASLYSQGFLPLVFKVPFSPLYFKRLLGPERWLSE